MRHVGYLLFALVAVGVGFFTYQHRDEVPAPLARSVAAPTLAPTVVKSGCITAVEDGPGVGVCMDAGVLIGIQPCDSSITLPVGGRCVVLDPLSVVPTPPPAFSWCGQPLTFPDYCRLD